MQRLIYCIFVFALFLKFDLAKGDEYFAFVGEKISVERIDPSPDTIQFSQKYNAKYRVLDIVYGNYNSEIIEFTLYSHKGSPAFAGFEHVLLYMTVHEGKYYHHNVYSPLFETVDGEWAGPYYTNGYSYKTNIEPEIIFFQKPVSFDISQLPFEYINEFYPKPYYKYQNKRAIAVYGNYVPELFLLALNGVLRADDFNPGRDQ
ncbi:hypothetical protein [Methylomonas sp. AM2-LC]|uniref:hypothetical protein n=1 Tax=Methylomonas sp. AM2-LC TaxID=3153301 RepID=UPI0032676B24